MSEQEDVLGRELAIAAKLDEQGVAIKVNVCAVVAFDRMLSSLVAMAVR